MALSLPARAAQPDTRAAEEARYGYTGPNCPGCPGSPVVRNEPQDPGNLNRLSLRLALDNQRAGFHLRRDAVRFLPELHRSAITQRAQADRVRQLRQGRERSAVPDRG